MITLGKKLALPCQSQSPSSLIGAVDTEEPLQQRTVMLPSESFLNGSILVEILKLGQRVLVPGTTVAVSNEVSER